MKYIFKNLYAIKKDQPIFLIFIIITVLITSIMINFSFGTYRVFEEKKLAEIEDLRHLDIAIDEDAGISKAGLDQCFQQLSGDLEELIYMILVSAEIDEHLNLECRFALKDGKYVPSSVFRDNLIKGNLTDHYFTEEQEANGELVALIGINQKSNSGNTLIIQGKSYQIIGRQSWDFDNPLVPFGSLNPETEINAADGIYLSFTKAISKKQYEKIKRIFETTWGDLVEVPPFSGETDQNRTVYNTMLLIAMVIAVISAINYAVLFQYIMLRQEQMLAVYRLCGMKRKQATNIYLAECLFIIITAYAAGAALFHVFVLPVLEYLSDTIRSEFSLKIYLILFLIYLITSIAILVLVIVGNIYRKSIVDLIRRA